MSDASNAAYVNLCDPVFWGLVITAFFFLHSTSSEMQMRSLFLVRAAHDPYNALFLFLLHFEP
jgi:hypothetical protein